MVSRDQRARQRTATRPGARQSTVDALLARRRRSRLVAALIAALALGGAGIGSAVALGGGAAGARSPQPKLEVEPVSRLGPTQPPPPQDALGPEGIAVPNAPALAGTLTAATGASIDGVSCDTSEQVVYHIHVHLTLFVDGVQREVPRGVGVPDPQITDTPKGPFVVSGSCFYWLHTHAADGIIHVESPVHRTYTLGQFFDLWGQALSSTQVGSAAGNVVAFYNGRHVLSDPRDIPLTPHADVQLDVGSPLFGLVVVHSWGQL